MPEPLSPKTGLGMKQARLAVGLRHVVDHVLVDLQAVGELHHRAELDAELVLGGGHLVVMLLNDHAHLGHGREHLGADVLGAVDGRHREVAALGAGPVAEVAHLVVGAGVGRQLGAVEAESGIVGLDGEADVVEDEELRLRAEHDAVADAGLLEIGLGALGDRAGIALVHLARGRLEHVAEDRHRRLREERVDVRARRIGHERHVGRLDAFPAGDGGAVEGIAVREHALVDARAVRRDVLHLAFGVGEAKVKELDVLVLHHLEHFASVFWSLCHC